MPIIFLWIFLKKKKKQTQYFPTVKLLEKLKLKHHVIDEGFEK